MSIAGNPQHAIYQVSLFRLRKSHPGQYGALPTKGLLVDGNFCVNNVDREKLVVGQDLVKTGPLFDLVLLFSSDRTVVDAKKESARKYDKDVCTVLANFLYKYENSLEPHDR